MASWRAPWLATVLTSAVAAAAVSVWIAPQWWVRRSPSTALACDIAAMSHAAAVQAALAQRLEGANDRCAIGFAHWWRHARAADRRAVAGTAVDAASGAVTWYATGSSAHRRTRASPTSWVPAMGEIAYRGLSALTIIAMVAADADPAIAAHAQSTFVSISELDLAGDGSAALDDDLPRLWRRLTLQERTRLVPTLVRCLGIEANQPQLRGLVAAALPALEWRARLDVLDIFSYDGDAGVADAMIDAWRCGSVADATLLDWLARVREAPATSAIVRGLSGMRGDIRGAAILALARIGVATADDRLMATVAHLAATLSPPRAAMLPGLDWPETPLLPLTQRAIGYDPFAASAWTRTAVFAGLAAMGDPRVLPILQNAIAEDDPTVRLLVIDAAALLPGIEARRLVASGLADDCAIVAAAARREAFTSAGIVAE